MTHQSGDVCPGCDSKLLTAHPDLQTWFRALKPQFLDAHISWAFRDEESQNQAFSDGKSKFKWPYSDHNHMENGVPCSRALDLFELSPDYTALFPPGFYWRINEFNKQNYPGLLWGGQWKSFKDTDHFYLFKASEPSMP